MSYDIIGDTHGQPHKLRELLALLGYEERAGVWGHPFRKALFVGDFIDRGPGQLETLSIVRSMVDAGSAEAVLGNHEFNAMAFYLPDPLTPGQHLRPRNERNRHQHQEFLKEVGEDSPLHKEWIEWFFTLPLWIEKPGLRLVHACWHAQAMEHLAPFMGAGNCLTPTLVELASRKGSKEYAAVEALCKGLEVDLPDPISFKDAEGIVRRRTRVKWWDPQAESFQKAALLGPKEREQLPSLPLPSSARVAYEGDTPVFFGHYWMTGSPRVLSPWACCVDYSAAREGCPLVAYRWQGERELSNDHWVETGPYMARKPMTLVNP